MSFFEKLAPYLGASGTALVGLDEGSTGPDDFAGEILIYASEVIAAIRDGAELPPLPDVLRTGATGRISGEIRAILVVAGSLLMIAQFQVSGAAAQALKYVNQVIRMLLSGQPVPAANVVAGVPRFA